jgi:hypothetical protein
LTTSNDRASKIDKWRQHRELPSVYERPTTHKISNRKISRAWVQPGVGGSTKADHRISKLDGSGGRQEANDVILGRNTAAKERIKSMLLRKIQTKHLGHKRKHRSKHNVKRSSNRSRVRALSGHAGAIVRLGLVGCGAINSGIIVGLCTSSAAPRYSIKVFDIDFKDSSSQARSLAVRFPQHVTLAGSNLEAVADADIILIGLGNFGPKALSPDGIRRVISEELLFKQGNGQLVVSLCGRGMRKM